MEYLLAATDRGLETGCSGRGKFFEGLVVTKMPGQEW